MEDQAPLAPPISLANLKPAKAEPKPPIILLYGVQGIGKSSFAADAPNPVMVDAEDGLHSIPVVKTPLLTSYADLMQFIQELYTGKHDFKTVVLDTLDAIEPLIQAEACRRNDWPDIEKAGYGKGYLAAAEIFRTELLPGLRALRDDRGMIVVMTAHAITKTVNDPTADSFDRWQPRLDKRLGEIVLDNADVIAFGAWKVTTVKAETKFGQKKTKAIGDGTRVLYLSDRPTHVSKTRYRMPPELPLDWDAFFEALNEAMTTVNKPKAAKEPTDGEAES